MLYNDKDKIALWTPYKNYSTSLRFYLLNKPYSEWKEYIGDEPCVNFNKRRFGYHTNNYPTHFENYKFILPIRNPYNRVISQYKFQSRFFTKHKTFKEWFWPDGKELIGYPVAGLYRYTDLLKVENVEEELKRLNLYLGYPIPKMNVSQNNNECVLTQEDKDLIYFLHYEDFIAGGYDK